MDNVTDEYGVWEVTEGNGYVSKINIAPTQKYKDENPKLFETPTPSTDERIASLESALSALMGV